MCMAGACARGRSRCVSRSRSSTRSATSRWRRTAGARWPSSTSIAASSTLPKQAARAALRRGDLDAARAHLDDLAEHPPVVGDVYMGAVTALARSEYALATGDPAAAARAARAGRGYADKRNLVPFQDDFDLAEG